MWASGRESEKAEGNVLSNVPLHVIVEPHEARKRGACALDLSNVRATIRDLPNPMYLIGKMLLAST